MLLSPEAEIGATIIHLCVEQLGALATLRLPKCLRHVLKPPSINIAASSILPQVLSYVFSELISDQIVQITIFLHFGINIHSVTAPALSNDPCRAFGNI